MLQSSSENISDCLIYSSEGLTKRIINPFNSPTNIFTGGLFRYAMCTMYNMSKGDNLSKSIKLLGFADQGAVAREIINTLKKHNCIEPNPGNGVNKYKLTQTGKQLLMEWVDANHKL